MHILAFLVSIFKFNFVYLTDDVSEACKMKYLRNWPIKDFLRRYVVQKANAALLIRRLCQ